MKAIILAAGLGTRLRPMTENTPKALVKVNQKPLVEYQIEYLKERGIDDIIIVVGYLKEQFDYLKEKYGVRLVFNDKYADYNNFYSLYLVKEELANSYVIDADNYLFKNMFRNDIERSTYFSVYREDCDNEWFLVYGDDFKVQDIIVEWNRMESSNGLEWNFLFGLWLGASLVMVPKYNRFRAHDVVTSTNCLNASLIHPTK